MFKHTLQPPVISLFSSTSSHPFLLCSHCSTSPSFPDDSFISLIDDRTDTFVTEPNLSTFGRPSASKLKVSTRATPASTLQDPAQGQDLRIFGRVLHLQSPDFKSTFIRWGSWKDAKEGLEIESGYLHFALRELEPGLGCYIDVGVRDDKGRVLIVRASTFQTQPRFYSSHVPPLLHLPLSFPASTAHLLTHWSILSLPLPNLLSSIPDFHPKPRFKSLEFVEVHANCRLKRIWCTAEKEGGVVEERMALRGMMTELVLFAS